MPGVAGRDKPAGSSAARIASPLLVVDGGDSVIPGVVNGARTADWLTASLRAE
ncbi:hypothetical protein [Streptomyces sp. NPDC003006]